MTIKKEIDIVINSDEANRKLDEVNSNIDKADDSTKQMTDSLNKMTGGAISGFKGILSGIKSGIVALKTFRGALIATGIGALIVAVGSLISYFTKSEEGANKLKVVFAAVGAVVDKLVDSLVAVGKFLAKVGGIIKDVVKGDKSLREGWNATKDAAKQMGKDIVDSYNSIGDAARKAMELQRRENDLRIQARENLVTEAKLIVALTNERLKMDDAMLTSQQRLEAINKAEKINIDIYNEKIRQAKEAFEIQKERNKLSESDEAAKLKEAELEAELIRLEAERNEKIKEYSDKRSNLIKADLDAKKAEQEAIQASIDADLDNEIKKFDEQLKAEQKLADAKQRLRDQEDADKKAKAEADKKRAEEQKSLEKEVMMARIGIAGQTFQLLTMMTKEHTKAYKAAAILQMVASGVQSVQSAFTTAAASPITALFPAYPYIQAGLAGAFSAVQLAKMKSTSDTANTSSPRTSGATGSPTTSAPSFNIVSGTGTNQIAEGINNANRQPVKAYVVGSDVSSQQELDRKIVDNASL